MPQLDIYTYFTQFQWFLLIFILLFSFVNDKLIPTFQSLFIIRNYIKNLLEVQDPKKEGRGLSTRLDFDYTVSTGAKRNESQYGAGTAQSYISQWDKIYDAQTQKDRAHSINKNKNRSQSNKLNDKNIINPAR